MNFLQLTNRLRSECGSSNSVLNSVVGANDEARRLASWISQAWLEIQTAEVDWSWLRGTFSFVTVNQQPSYTPLEAGIADFASWKIDSLRCYVTAAGFGSEQRLEPVDYDTWRDRYQYASYRTTYTRPVECAVTPDKQLALGPTPTGDYTIVGEYFKAPIELSADADVPALPERYHMAIVYLAMKYYALYESAPEVLARAEDGFARTMARVRLDQMPSISLGGALA